MLMRTPYGFFEKGCSRFVVVAPHAAGDDWGTEELAVSFANELEASVVVNNKYVKPQNSRAGKLPELIQDFNSLDWSGKEYVWDSRPMEMMLFYHDISFLREGLTTNPCVFVYVHGMKNLGDLGIDIGVGLKRHKGFLLSSDRHPLSGRNSGSVRAKPDDVLLLENLLGESLGAFRAGIGERFVGWSKRNGIQWHEGTSDYSIQLEFNRTLREIPEHTAAISADCLKKVYD